jgi:hypothetical protein
MDSMKKKRYKGMIKKQKINNRPAHDRDIENPVDSAEVKVESDGWVYFYKYIESYGLGLFKARPDGSSLALIVNSSDQRPRWSDLRNLETKDGFICFVVSIEYSEFDEDHQEYNRYRDDITCKIQPDGKNLTEVSRSRGYLGSSN